MRNRQVRSEVRTEIKKFLEAVEGKDKDLAGKAYLVCQKLIDSAAGKGVFPKRNADRKKSRLHARLNTLV
jgi:small subunit ribosomal protein S20